MEDAGWAFVGLGICLLLLGMGTGIAVSWSREDPILDGCREVVSVIPKEDRTTAFMQCLELRLLCKCEKDPTCPQKE